MNTGEKKDKKDKTGFFATGCCSENFREMSEMMRNCCTGHKISDGYTMMKAMMEMCCGSKTENAKGDAEPPDEQDDKVKTSKISSMGECCS